MRELVLGGARSGKSRYAEGRALESGLKVIYIATAQARDTEMAERIAQHQQWRPCDWGLVEEPLHLVDRLRDYASPMHFLLVDCLTLWLSNWLSREDQAALETQFQRERAALLDILPTLPGYICLVSNEVGCGIIPDNPLARRFVDQAGWLHQDLAQRCERVVWVAAGIAQVLKLTTGY